MRARAWLSAAFATLLVAGACATTSGNVDDNAGPVTERRMDGAAVNQGRCDIGDQSEDLNRILRRASEGDVDASLASRAGEIQRIAEQAGNGAVNANDGQHEVACRFISLRAYGALLNVPDRAGAAAQAIVDQSDRGDTACRSPMTRDEGVVMACNHITMWRNTIGTWLAVQEVKAIEARLDSPRTNPVSEADWALIGTQVTRIRDNIRDQWPAVEGEREHKRRMACQAQAVMLRVTNWDAASGSPGRGAVFQLHDPILDQAVTAIPITAGEAQCAAGQEESQACMVARRRLLESSCINSP